MRVAEDLIGKCSKRTSAVGWVEVSKDILEGPSKHGSIVARY